MLLKKKSWEMGERCELWGGNERKKMRWWEGMFVCGGGEEKRKAEGVNGWWGKKKEIKKKKEMGSGVYLYGGKKGRVEKERSKKNWKGKN